VYAWKVCVYRFRSRICVKCACFLWLFAGSVFFLSSLRCRLDGFGFVCFLSRLCCSWCDSVGFLFLFSVFLSDDGTNTGAGWVCLGRGVVARRRGAPGDLRSFWRRGLGVYSGRDRPEGWLARVVAPGGQRSIKLLLVFCKRCRLGCRLVARSGAEPREAKPERSGGSFSTGSDTVDSSKKRVGDAQRHRLEHNAPAKPDAAPGARPCNTVHLRRFRWPTDLN
jgi:hypothetical protein